MRLKCVWLFFHALAVASVMDISARLVRNHVGSICSTWGREHYKTFDGDVYQFPGTCEYNLASDCHESYQKFSVHLRRQRTDGNPTVSHVLVTINELAFRLTKSAVTVNDVSVTLPYHSGGVQVERNAVYIKLLSKVGIVVMWNGDDAVMVELDRDYANRTCGLCGDFNGLPVYNELIHNGRKISHIEFGNKQKVHRPNDECEDPYEEDEDTLEAAAIPDSCRKFQTICRQMLRSESWSSCSSLLNPEPYIQACIQDMCGCTNATQDSCVCSTLSEFSRQCSHAGGRPPPWRKPKFCAIQCPLNMVHMESGSPCLDTCTHSDTSSMCEEHTMDGCFCPSGTVLDDISSRGCIAQSECQCRHNEIYNPGDVLVQDRKNCTCLQGKWSCENLDTSATCALEEGSHVTTFDGKTYTFHGNCYYTFAKVKSKDKSGPRFTILVQLAPCANEEYDTCLKTLKILLNNDKNNVLRFTSDGTVTQNKQSVSLPYQSGDIHIFRASSFHIFLQSSFGLQIQIQHVPLMQVYVRLEPGYRAKTRGLCGNYNLVLSDDVRTPQGIVEGLPATFGNSWRANQMCQDTKERLDDPCSLSVESELYAKHWCALLMSPNSTFARCHQAVDPQMYYKRCHYASCNCDKSESCLCAVFSSYARACAAQGVFLVDWRESVCDKYTKGCPASQSFSYKHHRCQLTCRSLSLDQQTCTSDFLPVDGCSCSEGLYLDDKGVCIPKDKCPCYHNEVLVKPGKSINIRDEHCVCNNGMLHCHSWRLRTSTCPSPKVFFNCSAVGPEQQGVQCAPTCLNLDTDDCESTECESGCQCPVGLLDNGQGSCVKESDCPCQHHGYTYAAGAKIKEQCNTCVCKSGKWDCTSNKCPGTCVIYGSGHHNTFDQRAFAFQGACSYIAVKSNCGNRTAQDTFGIITENVPCGSTGTTCSKIIRIQLGRMEIKLSKGRYEEEDLGHGPQIRYKIRPVGLYLVIESTIGVAVMWDRKTTVRILLEPQHSGQVCGLCGDFDGNAQNDFTTQGQLPVSSVLEFANSWKVSSNCPDTTISVDPCVAAPKRHHWAKIVCSIIIEDTFKECHNKVDPRPFYENCVKDSCACDSGGDCECFCTAVAAYAQACNEAGECVPWRTPEICPVFCDYYNSPGDCKWHYHPCHKPCYKTCLSPDGICSNPVPTLEGCYPVCPEDKPIFDEDKQVCVEQCDGCLYNGAYYEENEVIYNVTDNLGVCYYAICVNATVIEGHRPCSSSTPSPTTIVSSTPTAPPSTQTTEPPTKSTAMPTAPTSTTIGGPTTTTTSTTIISSTTPCIPKCEWTEWFDVHNPKLDGNDLETYENIKNNGKEICANPKQIECRSTSARQKDFHDFVSETKQVVKCDLGVGLQCLKKDQLRPPRKCFNYQIRLYCCYPCENRSTTTTAQPTTVEPTTTTISTATPTAPQPSTTGEPTTITRSTASPTAPPPSPTVSQTTTSRSTVTSSPPSPTTTAQPTTTTLSTVTPTAPPPSPTGGSTTTSRSTATPTAPPPSTTGEPTTTTRSTATPTAPSPSPTTGPPTTSRSTVTSSPPSPTTTAEPTTTTRSTVTSSAPPPTTTVEPTTTTRSTATPATPSTRECICVVNGKHYRPGDTIFDGKHIGSGICLTMTCSNICEIHNQTYPCLPSCPGWNVTQNETFFLCNCTMARCIENNTIEIVPYECPPLKNITCFNGKKPVLVYDEYHCCQYYACDCVCEGWGDPHYITFDGLYYSYQGNCTYVLMEEILPKHHLRILIDNVFCDPTEDVSCPRSIIVEYGSRVPAITLKNHNLIGAPVLEALTDGGTLKLPYSQQGIKIFNTGINLVLEIPRLQAIVTFGITGFSITLPSSLFGDNTQGHCGKCNNNQGDDCMLPGGRLVPSCAIMADYWLANDIYQPECQIPTTHPTQPPLPTMTPCKPDSICDLLKSSVFMACHPFVKPDNFYQGCVYDSCHVPNSAMECTSLQTYAAACAQAGVCLHWRNHTTLCASDCPSNKIYKPCGPADQPSCEDNPEETTMNYTTEGCFCPDGMKLFSKASRICVDKCGCLDSEGIPRVFNEEFDYKCQSCMCEASTKAVTCKPKVCPAPPVVSCDGPGFDVVNQTNPADPCCTTLVCECRSFNCPINPMTCPIGYVPVVGVPQGKCCPEHKCEPKRVCVQESTEYELNASVPATECQECSCINEVDPKSGLLTIRCQSMQCQKDCDPGYEYVKEDSDECCGKCVQKHCILNVNGTNQFIKEGETWSPVENRCEHHSCVKRGGMLATISSHIVCPVFKESNCEPDTIQSAADGCCKVCVEKEKACKVVSNKTRIFINECESLQEVDIPYCEGSCNTFTRYHPADAAQNSCSCCKKQRYSSRSVKLNCSKGGPLNFTYVHVEKCSCGHTECSTTLAPTARRMKSLKLV